MKKLLQCGFQVLDGAGLWLGLVTLRLCLGWEFLEAGLEKFHGQNWFADIQDKFPAPFNLLPTNLSWGLATWFEILGGIALVLGLATRFFSVSLIVLTLVAIAAVHWPESWSTLADLQKGYVFTDQGFGNFKLPALYIIMLVPLVLQGPGKLSLDQFIRAHYLKR